MKCSIVLLVACCIQNILSDKVKVVMYSDQEDSRMDEEESPHTEAWDYKKKVEITMLPFLKKAHRHVEEKQIPYEEEKSTTEKPRQIHPNEMIFPLIYRQNHINSMFKFGENWYTWSTEKRTDGSKAINYYICYEEPKHCDEVGWERTDSIPKCAFQIDSLLPDDRACLNSFGIEPHNSGMCLGGEHMKVSDMVHSCGPRIRSLWRFLRVGHRSPNAAKPADVNSLICEDEEECFVSIEYRIHHDRITFSLHEPSRGQTFKSALKREVASEDENKIPVKSETRAPHNVRRPKKSHDDDQNQRKKIKVRSRKVVEGKGIVKERNDSGYVSRRAIKNKIKIKEDISDNASD
ncbi:unnamed protein product [Leptidea sinapis]|uniref:Uncharacterized protein n=1 Tax=Leptidea sinapis TaxID=189913 RepID=A0A5E4Q7X4_9NEOP|nr:unnamed protein product [Leptidea sinapis]